MYKDSTLKDYLDELAAKLPVPGGGSSAALCAAMAAALVSMVVNFTLGKPKYEKYAERLKEVINKSEFLRKEFLRLVDLDAIAYKSNNMRDAVNVPFMVARLCLEGIKLCPPLLKEGNINLVSDIAVAAVFFESAFVSASFNVKINLKSLGDKKFCAGVRKELSRNNRQISKIRMQVEERVGDIIRG